MWKRSTGTQRKILEMHLDFFIIGFLSYCIYDNIGIVVKKDDWVSDKV